MVYIPAVVAVREGRPEDLDWIIVQLRALSKFFGTRTPLFKDEEFARQSMLAIMERHFCRVAEADGQRVGLIAGLVTPHVLNPDVKVLCETFWWVVEGPHAARAGMMLMNEFVAWGREHVHWITFSLQEHKPVGAGVLERSGFHLHERTYLMEVA